MIEEGSEYTIETASLWTVEDFPQNSIIEVPLLCTSLEVEKNISANFLIRDVRLNTEAEICLEAKSLGCADVNLTRRLSGLFNRKKGIIHVCATDPCHWGEIYALHVRKFKRWTFEAFSQDLLSAGMKAQLKKWVNEESGPDEEEANQDGEEAEEPGWEMPADPKRPAEEHPPEKEAGVMAGKDLPEKARPKRASALKGKDKDQEARAGLRARLDTVKEKVMTTPRLDRTPAGPAVRDRKREPISVEDSPSPELSPSVERELLESGTELREVSMDETAKRKRRIPVGDRDGIARKRKKDKEATLAITTGDELVMAGSRQVSDGKNNSSKSCQMQLAKRASETALVRENRRREQKKKATKQQPAHQLVKALTQLTKGRSQRRSGSSKKKVKVKKEKRNKPSSRRKKKPDGGDDSPDSEGSYSDEDDYDSEEESAKSSESGRSHRGEAPLKRKSRKDPGSVLLMLVEHARNQLDQSARVSVPDEEMKTVTGGIRLSSYFQIIVRPQLGNSMAQAREMHHLANSMDLLRQGQLTVLGDVLASRFMSLHQSVLDGSWTTARHMELMPLEDVSAAGTDIVLQARRRAKLAAKAASPELWSPSPYSRAKGGRGRGSGWDQSQDQKGKGRKGPKGKGKGKSWWPQAPPPDGEGEIPKKKDKGGDK